MRTPFPSLVGLMATLLVFDTTTRAVEWQISIQLDPGGVQISYLSQEGVVYQLERSTNCVDWQPAGPLRQGTGSVLVEDSVLPLDPQAFFRVGSQVASTNLSPSPARMAEMLVGTSWKGYRFTSTNRFRWFSEAGNWSYTKTGWDTGLIVFTYDEDDNNPLIYREEAALTFLTLTGGTGRYSEWFGNVEDPTSVGTFSFDFGVTVTAGGSSAAESDGRWSGSRRDGIECPEPAPNVRLPLRPSPEDQRGPGVVGRRNAPDVADGCV